MAKLRATPTIAMLLTLGLLPHCGASNQRAGGKIDASMSVCAPNRLLHGGTILQMPDGAPIWYKLQGKPNAPVVAYLHGGPGYNAYAFEQSAGKLLEQAFRVLYIDQRGCGRSGFEGADSAFGMRKTVDDIERIRAMLGVQKLALIGHSFGGIVAAEYVHRYPDRVTRVAMVEATPYVERAFAHQLAFADTIASKSFPGVADEVHALARKEGNTFGRLRKVYGLVGRKPFQERLHYASSAKQAEMEALDDASGILGCTSSRALTTLETEGYFSDTPPGVAMPLDVPALVVAGRASQVIGTENIEAAVKAWHAELVVVDDAGHFVYFEQPLKFAEIMTAWLRGTAAQPRD